MGWKEELETLFEVTIDEEQMQVITDHHSVLQVIAGAGSGKTFTICCKVYYLVHVKKVDPKRIMMLSYTNYACSEVQAYFKKMKLEIEVLTFHKFALNFLKLNQMEYQIKTEEKKVVEEWVEQMREKEKKEYIDRLLTYRSTNVFKKYQSKLWYLFCSEWKSTRNLKYMQEKVFEEYREGKNPLLLESLKKYRKEKGYLLFQDMIPISLSLLRENKTVISDYQYLFVDEFQDISKERFHYIAEYTKKVGNALVVVGDDYQSIYQFANSDIKYFTEFSQFFENSQRIFLKNTYRNSQELLDYARKVISKNTGQIDKRLCSNHHLKDPIQVIYYASIEQYAHKIAGILKQLFERETKLKVLILARYQFDFEIMHEKSIQRTLRKCPETVQIDMLTIHKAKGLGYDEVILLNLRKGKYGFPSTVMKVDIEEERRLFYVALTRTKNHVYLLIPKQNSSIFVEELLKD